MAGGQSGGLRKSLQGGQQTAMDFAISGFSVLVIAIAVLAIVIVTMSVKAVPQGYEHTVERFGRYTKTLGPGLGMIFPVIERIGVKMNMMETVLDVPSQEVLTKATDRSEERRVGTEGVRRSRSGWSPEH